jgi:predicted nucleic acid-binding protein
MHKVWLDINVLLDYLLRRTGFEIPAIELIKKIERKEIMAFTSVINLIHTHYQLRKFTTEGATRAILQNLVRLIHVQDIPPDIASRALSNLSITDFEDAVQYELALLSEADFLLTRNLRDFASGPGPVVCTAEHYLLFFQRS